MPLLTIASDRIAGASFGPFDLNLLSDSIFGVSDFWKVVSGGVVTKSGGGSLISVSNIGPALIEFVDYGFTISWTLGTPTSSGSNTVGLYSGSTVGNGIRVTISLGTEPIEVWIATGGYAAGLLADVTLSDASASPVSNSDIVDTAEDGEAGILVVAAQAGSAGQTLTIDLKVGSQVNGNSLANVVITALAVRSASRGLDRYRTALEAVQSGTANAKVLVIGDSNEVAYQPTDAMANNAIARSWPALMAGQMVNNPATFVGYIGDNHATAEGSSPNAFNNKVTQGTGWSVNTLETLGGRMFVGGTTNGASHSYTPGFAFTKFRVAYNRFNGSAEYSVNVNGGSSLGTLNMSDTVGGVFFEEFTASGDASATINIVSNGTATGRILGIEAWDDANKSVHIVTAGVPGWSAFNWAAITNDYSPLNAIRAYQAHLVIVKLGTNDMTFSTRSDMREYLRRIFFAAKGYGSVLALGFPYMGEWGPTYATQDIWRADVAAIATELGVEYHDITDDVGWTSYPTAVSAGYMETADQVHITDTGHQSRAELTAPLIDLAPPVALQTLRPDSDVSAGPWTPSTGSDLYAMLDEEPANDADYASTSSNGEMVIGFQNGPTPSESGSQKLTTRVSGSPAKKLIITAYDGATEIDSFEVANLTVAMSNIEWTLSPEFTSLSNPRFGFDVQDASSPPALTVSYAGANAAFAYDNATSPLSVAYPTTVVNKEKLILFVGQKPGTANGGGVTTPDGWTLITSLTGAGGYGATLGADTGNTNLFAYERTADGTEGGTSFNLAFSDNNVLWTRMLRASNLYGIWATTTATTGSDTTAGNVSITGGADIDFLPGDLALWAMCIPTDVTTPSQFSAHAITATGATFGSATEIDEADSTTGNDIGGYLAYASCTAGDSSAAPTVTATATGTTTNVRGPGIILRLRTSPPAEFARVSYAKFTAPDGSSSGEFEVSSSETLSLTHSQTSALEVTNVRSEAQAILESQVSLLAILRQQEEAAEAAEASTAVVSSNDTQDEVTDVSESQTGFVAREEDQVEDQEVSEEADTSMTAEASQADSVDATEESDAIAAKTGAASESIDVLEDVAGEVFSEGTIEEITSVEELTSSSLATENSQDETVELDDSQSASNLQEASAEDSLEVEDSPSALAASSASQSESSAPEDVSEVVTSKVSGQTETTEVTEAVSAALAVDKDQEEAVTSNEAATASMAAEVDADEELEVTEASDAETFSGRVQDDAQSVNEETTTAMSASTAQSETLTVEEVVSATAASDLGQSEIVSAEEETDADTISGRQQQESAQTSENPSSELSATSALSDEVVVDEEAVQATSVVGLVSEDTEVNESIQASSTNLSNQAETVDTTENLDVNQTANSVVLESVVTDDEPSAITSKTKEQTEGVILSDSSEIVGYLQREGLDSVTPIDVQAVAMTSVTSVSEESKPSEVSSAQTSTGSSQTDTANLGDESSASLALNPVMLETVDVAEGISKSMLASVFQRESLTLSALTTRSMQAVVLQIDGTASYERSQASLITVVISGRRIIII